MSFVWFVVALVIFYFVFWKVLSMIFALPAIGLGAVVGWASEGESSIIKRLVKWPAFLTARFFGFELQTITYGFAAGVLAKAGASIHPSNAWLYFLAGGLFAGSMTAPNGEGSWIGRLEALTLFLIVAMVLPSAQPTLDSEKNSLIVPAQSIGSMRLGMSPSQAREVWGAPSGVHRLDEGVEAWDYVLHQSVLYVSRNEVYEILTHSPTFATKEGIRVGTRMEQVFRILGPSDCQKTLSGGKVYSYSKIGLMVGASGEAVNLLAIVDSIKC
jgi:hypothetical protein